MLPIAYHSNQFKARYTDEYTGEVLDNFQIQAAVMEELGYFNDRVGEVSTREDMMKVDGHVFARERWVSCNKGDAVHPDIRNKLAACEIKRATRTTTSSPRRHHSKQRRSCSRVTPRSAQGTASP